MKTRHGVLVVASLLAASLLVAMFLLPTPDSGLVPVGELQPGDCFLYPGDGATPESVKTAPCSDVHYAEIYGTTLLGDDNSCVDGFESYTGASNYWETGYIIGFLQIDDSEMFCYLYAGQDFAGSLANSY